MGRVVVHDLGDVVGRRGGRPATPFAGVIEVVREPHRAQHDHLDLGWVASRLARPGGDVGHRPFDCLTPNADFERDQVGVRAGQAHRVRPRASEHQGNPSAGPGDADLGSLEVDRLAGQQALDLGYELAHLGHLGRLQPQRADRAVAAPEPEHDATGMDAGQRRVAARRDGEVSRDRIGHRSAEGQPLGGLQTAGHVHVRVLPDHLRVAHPGVTEPRAVSAADRLEIGLELDGQEVGAELHRAILTRGSTTP